MIYQSQKYYIVMVINFMLKKYTPLFALVFLLSSCSDFDQLNTKLENNISISNLNFQTQSRVIDRINSSIIYPSDKNGNLSIQNNYSIIILLQGGLVSASRYLWLANHFASNGYIVMLPNHAFNLPFFEVDNSELLLNSFLDKSVNNDKFRNLKGKIGKTIIMGHSLGGVVATYQWQKYNNIDGLVLLASYPDEKTPPLKINSGNVLSITGSNDKKSLPDTVKKGFDSFKSPKTFAEISGMNHYAWTDNFTSEELKSDGVINGNLGDLRVKALSVIDSWLKFVVNNDQTELKKLAENSTEGIKIINE